MSETLAFNWSWTRDNWEPDVRRGVCALISLVKSKIGLLREITQILFSMRKKENIRKGINRELTPAKERKNPKTDFSIYTASCLF